MLSEIFVLDALQAELSGKQFPLDFDDIWQEGGYTRRDNALRAMVNSRLRVNFDYLKIEGNKVKRISDKYYLSSDAFKSYLLSANTDKGEETRRYFIDVEKQHRQNLERLLKNAVLTNQPESTKPAFPYSSKQLHEWLDYCNLAYTRSVIKEDYQEGVDYITIDKEIYTTADTAQILLTCARPSKGVSVPEELRMHPFPWDKFQVHVLKKTNRRRSCSKLKPEVPGQTSLF